jgi:hypothetical protein
MLAFAHIFAGVIIGLVTLDLTKDRRSLPICIIGAILPDLIDKPLSIIFPQVMSSSRTLGHALLFAGLVCAVAIVIWRYRSSIVGIAFACAIFSHQVLDTMWTIPSTWFFPAFGPFLPYSVPDYFGHFFWIEIGTPSEWIFAYASFIIIVVLYFSSILPGDQTRLGSTLFRTLPVTAVLTGGMGLVFIIGGLGYSFPAIMTSTYTGVTLIMAGIIAIIGTFAMLELDRSQRI